MGWIFAISSFLCIWGFGYLMVLAVRQHFFSDFHRRFASQQSGILLVILLFIVMFPVLAVVFGVACWTNLNGKRTAKAWGIAACLVYVLASLWPIIHRFASILGAPGIELAIGVIGLVAFSLSPGIKREADDALTPREKRSEKKQGKETTETGNSN
jgi:hypothetical protein